jgi:hypothetical protein
MERIKNELNLSRLSLVFFALAIGVSFRFSSSIAIEQSARNQAKIFESQLQNLEAPNQIIEDQDTHSLQNIHHAIQKVLGRIS